MLVVKLYLSVNDINFMINEDKFVQLIENWFKLRSIYTKVFNLLQYHKLLIQYQYLELYLYKLEKETPCSIKLKISVLCIQILVLIIY